MKRIVITAGLGLLCVATAQAQTGDGQINFTGTVTAATCEPRVNGDAATRTVTLPTVSTTTLASSGQTAGATPFSIVLVNCSGQTDTARAYFEPGTSVDDSTGRLINVNGGAENVQVQLLGAEQQNPIQVGNSEPSQPTVTIDGSGTPTLNYIARYYATGEATAGSVDTFVNYTIVYQ